MPQPGTGPLSKGRSFHYGWVVVAVATLAMLLGFGVNITVSIFIGPWEDEFGWLRADMSLAYTVITIGAATGGMLFGHIADRLGAKPVAVFGALVMGAGMIVLSRLDTLPAIYGVYFLIGFLGFGCLFAPLLSFAGHWFDRRKGLAIGIVTAGGAIGQGIVPFILRYVITITDWRAAALSFGVVILAVQLPLLLLLRAPPSFGTGRRVSDQSDANDWGLPHQVTLPWLALAGIFCCICMSVPLVHLVPLATDIGFSPQLATGFLLALMTAGMIGRVLFGLAADRIGGLRAYFLASFGQTACVFWFTQFDAIASLFVLSALFGFFFAGVMTSLLIASREAAPARMAGFAAAFVSATAWLGMGVGSYQAGFFFDSTGDYVWSYANAAIAGLLNLAIVAGLIWFRHNRSRRAQPLAA